MSGTVGPAGVSSELKKTGIPASILESLENTKVEYRTLGNSGLCVSVPILGCMSYGTSEWLDWVLDEDKALPLLKAAYDRGVNTWDTANVYSNGTSEKVIAKAIKTYSIPRHKLVIMSKCSGIVSEDKSFWTSPFPEIKASKDYVNQAGLSRNAIITAVNASLARLETDYIDVLQIHRFDPITPIEETMSTLNDLVRSGKVRYIGASSMWAFQFVMMQECAKRNGWTQFISMQNRYNLLYREEEREMNKYCRLTGVGLIPWGPLCGGHLARPRPKNDDERTKRYITSNMFKAGNSPTDHKIIDRVQEIAEKKGWPMGHVAIAWIMPKITSPIIGISSVKRLDESLEVKGKTLSEEEIKYLEELYQDRPTEGYV